MNNIETQASTIQNELIAVYFVNSEDDIPAFPYPGYAYFIKSPRKIVLYIENGKKITWTLGNSEEVAEDLDRLYDKYEALIESVPRELNNKVDKIPNKSLSTNDLTDILKNEILKVKDKLNIDDADIRFLTKEDAINKYITKETANNIFIKKDDAVTQIEKANIEASISEINDKLDRILNPDDPKDDPEDLTKTFVTHDFAKKVLASKLDLTAYYTKTQNEAYFVLRSEYNRDHISPEDKVRYDNYEEVINRISDDINNINANINSLSIPDWPVIVVKVNNNIDHIQKLEEKVRELEEKINNL